MSQMVAEPCPFCHGKRRYGAARAPCLCTIGTGEPRAGVTVRIPSRDVGWPRRLASHERPRCRGDCSNVPRPCPFVGCVYNTYLQIKAHGDVKITRPHLYPWDVPPGESCILDLADQGGMTLEQIAQVYNWTRERVRQIEVSAIMSVQIEARKRGLLNGDE